LIKEQQNFMTNKTEILDKAIEKKVRLDLLVTSSIINKVCDYLGMTKEELLNEIEFTDQEIEKIVTAVQL